MKKVIDKVKNMRKQAHLKMEYKHKYAFIGVGNHSFNNLYPVLNYLRVPLKYIVTKGDKNADLINTYFPNVEGTNDLDKVLNDPEIKSVFICASPSSHFNLVKQALSKGKNVFVEKPPCETRDELEELIQLEEKSEGFCLVGVQKRYSPSYTILKNKLKDVSSYNFRYLTGLYPEGDPVLDLFIHPIDIISFIFGPCLITSIETVANPGNGKGISVFAHFKHEKIIGNIELSTDYSWTTAQEKLEVNTSKGIFKATNCEKLTFETKPKILMGVPKEKVFGFQPSTTILTNENSFLPVLEHNQLYTAGYYNEIHNFVELSEGRKGKNLSTLSSMVPTYLLLKEIETTCIM